MAESSESIVYDLSGGSTTLIDVPVKLVGIYVTVSLNSHPVAIKNGSTVKKRVPANTAAGSQISGENVLYDTNLIIEPNASGTGEIEVVFQRQGPSRAK